MKLAFFVRPHLGGTFSVFANLREGLRDHGIDLRWIGLDGPAANEGEIDRDTLAQGFFASDEGGRAEDDRAAALVNVLKRENFDGVFINVLAEQLQMNIARFLPTDMMRIMIVHTITPATYAAAAAIRDNVHATVAVCERARRDLVSRYGFSPQWTWRIDNAVDTRGFDELERLPSGSGLRLLVLGRIEDASKGVFWLPRIMERVSPSTSLTIAGDGPDLPELRRRSSRVEGRVTFLGAVPRERVPHLLATHDVLVMPSRFEGSPLTLIEAMAAGCVPVVSRISGVTDMMVEHAMTGRLFPPGDWRRAAREINRLEEEPLELRDLSANARKDARARFGVERMSGAYAELITELRAARRQVARPLPLEAWSMPAGFRSGLRGYLPAPVKNWLRVAYERL